MSAMTPDADVKQQVGTGVSPYARRTRERVGKPTPEKKYRTPFLLLVFLICLAIPINIFIGSIRLSPYRIVLILMFVPSLFMLFGGKLGGFRRTDFFMIFYALWGALALALAPGPSSSLESIGIFIIESLGAYMLGRALVRDQGSFKTMAVTVFVMLMALFPFAIAEAVSHKAILLDALRPFFSVVAEGRQEPRFGLRRAQVLFEHPIIYGIFASSILGMSFYVIGKGTVPGGLLRVALVATAAVLSLSSSTIAVIVIQVLFIAWDKLTKSIKRRWLILFLIFLALYFVIDILSNRSPFHVMVSYLTLSSGSAYNRILIWNFGSAEALRHPLFGIGFNEWTRPRWMSSSMDNMWLVVAVQNGLPAVGALILAFFFMLRDIGRRTFRSPTLRRYRAGIFISLGGMMIGGATTDYWNAMYCWFLFLLGSGMWLLNAEKPDEQTDPDDELAEERNARRSRRSVPAPRRLRAEVGSN